MTGSDETGITQTSLTKQNVTVRLNGTATTNFSFANSGRGTINDKTINMNINVLLDAVLFLDNINNIRHKDNVPNIPV